MNKRYTVAQVRERLSDALDAAQRGESVTIERHGVRYRLSLLDAKSRRPRKRNPMIEILDPAVAGGQWSWDWSPGRLAFTDTGARKNTRKKR